MKIGIAIGLLVMVLGGALALSDVRVRDQEHVSKFGPLVIREERSSSLSPGWGIAIALGGLALLGYSLGKKD